MRSYRAARRDAEQVPVTFEIGYEVQVQATKDPDALQARAEEQGKLLSAVALEDLVWEERVQRFACHGALSSLTVSELGYHADVDSATPEGAAMLRKIYREAFGSDAAYKEFYDFVTEHHIDDDLLVDVMTDLVEEFTGRPTQRPSGSQQSPSTAGEPSRVVSLPGGFSTSATPLASSS